MGLAIGLIREKLLTVLVVSFFLLFFVFFSLIYDLIERKINDKVLVSTIIKYFSKKRGK